MPEAYDYTREPANPLDHDDFEVGGYTVRKSADESERDNSFRQPPPGEHEMEVIDCQPGDLKYYEVEMPDKSKAAFSAFPIKVRLAMVGDPKCGVDDYIVPPPTDERTLPAYYEGAILKADGTAGKPGWESEKYGHFMARLGFIADRGRDLPAEARRLGNWKRYPDGSPRSIVATIQPGTPYTDRSGNERMGFARVKPYSYKLSKRTAAKLGLSGGAAPAGAANGATQGKGAGAAAPPAPAISVSDL